jgi:hypothetical protein
MRYEALARRVQEALEAGQIQPADVERLLDERAAQPAPNPHRRPDIGGVLGAAGAVVAFAGAALLYAIGWSGYGHDVRIITPFGFPVVALVAAVALVRARRPGWQVELAGAIGYLALTMAFLVSGNAFDAGPGYGVAAGVAGTLVVLAMHRLAGARRLTTWGLGMSLVSLTSSAAAEAGLSGHSAASWVLLAQSAVALAVGLAAVGRRPGLATGALGWAALLAFSASLAGIGDWQSASPWHALLSVAVVATLLAAAALESSGLLWVGAVGGLVWLGAVAGIVGQRTGWAVAVILIGLGLAGLGMLVSRLRHPHVPVPGTGGRL